VIKYINTYKDFKLLGIYNLPKYGRIESGKRCNGFYILLHKTFFFISTFQKENIKGFLIP
jgi:hypothetical protein